MFSCFCSYRNLATEHESLMQKYLHLLQIVETEKTVAKQLRQQIEDGEIEIERLKSEVIFTVISFLVVRRSRNVNKYVVINANAVHCRWTHFVEFAASPHESNLNCHVTLCSGWDWTPAQDSRDSIWGLNSNTQLYSAGKLREDKEHILGRSGARTYRVRDRSQKCRNILGLCKGSFA